MDISMARCPGCGQSMQIARAHCSACEVSLDGAFEVSALGKLSLEDQLFVVAFMRTHGSIKRMEGLFGISYPTVKNRLNGIVAQLDKTFQVPTSNGAVLDQLAAGEITVEQAMERLS